jgi:hypothetical protein
MASMPIYHVSKGPFRLLDDKFGKGDHKATMDGVMDGTDGGPGLRSGVANATLQARTHKHVNEDKVTHAARTHFEDHWLSSWWPHLAVEDTLRLGMAEAIDCARAANLPMEFLWVCLADDIFEIYYSQGDRQVTVLILTPPPPPDFDTGPLKDKETLWVVKEQDADDTRYLTINGTPAGRVPAPVALTTGGNGTKQIIRQQVWHA